MSNIIYTDARRSLNSAITVASIAHMNQSYNDQPYIYHPMRVAMTFSDIDCQIVAILHDVIEDNEMFTIAYLRTMGFSEKILEAIDAITHRPGESYMDYIMRCAQNAIALLVKMADIHENMKNLSYIRDHQRRERMRRKYSIAYRYLTSVIETQCFNA